MKIERHRAAIEAGADPKLVTQWLAEAQGERLAAETELAALDQPKEVTADDGMELLWSTEGLHIVDLPRVVRLDGGDEIVVTIALDRSKLVLVAFEPVTGEELWRRPTTESATAAASGLIAPAIGSDLIYHVAPNAGGDTVEAVEPAYGEVVWSSQRATAGFRGWLGFCDTSHETLCIESHDSGMWEIDTFTGDVTTGAVGLDGPVDPSLPVQEIVTEAHLGEDVYWLAGGDLARIVDGVLLWQRSADDIFAGVRVSPDYGSFFYSPVDGLLLGYLGWIPDIARGSQQVPIVTAPMVGLDPLTGATLWLQPGQPFCGRLDHVLGSVADGVEWIRCRSTGTATMEDSRFTGWSVETSTIEGFDPLTGDTRWSVDLGQASALWDHEDTIIRVDAATFAIHRDDGHLLVVDTRDGSSPPIQGDDVGWCVEENGYDDGSLTRRGAYFAEPCTIDGERRPTPNEPDDNAGASVDGVFIWMDNHGLHAAR